VVYLYLFAALAPGLLLTVAGSAKCQRLSTLYRAVGIGCLASIAGVVLAITDSFWGQTRAASIWRGPADSVFSLLSISVYVDRVTAIMWFVVAVIGSVVVRFSARYLDGNPRQPHFLRWLVITLVATQLVILSGNLVMFLLSWLLVSLGVHKLLVFYPERPRALACARKTFWVSRLGDLAIVGAIILLAQEFGTLDFADLFPKINDSLLHPSFTLQMIGFLIALGALTKSAQFPFHSWLPDSLETPTPVSALMHAGIINAGGFLLIRMSPVMQTLPLASVILATFGAITAAYGMSVMVTQPTIKKRLAYSTVGQMGFMIMQCGLGLYALALLHIVAHAFYKAYAFLRAGSAMDQANEQLYFPIRTTISPYVAIPVVLALGALVVLNDPSRPERAIPISNLLPVLVVWIIAASHLVLGSASIRSFKGLSVALGLLMTVVMVALYGGLSLFFSWALSDLLPPPLPFSWSVGLGISLLFVVCFALQCISRAIAASSFGERFFIHLHNGFYLGLYGDRLVESVRVLRTKDVGGSHAK